LTLNAKIHYTTDGNDPTEDDPSIDSGEAVQIFAGITLKARAFRPDLLPSEIVTGSFTNFDPLAARHRPMLLNVSLSIGHSGLVAFAGTDDTARVIFDASGTFNASQKFLDYS